MRGWGQFDPASSRPPPLGKRNIHMSRAHLLTGGGTVTCTQRSDMKSLIKSYRMDDEVIDSCAQRRIDSRLSATKRTCYLAHLIRGPIMYDPCRSGQEEKGVVRYGD